jgi:hypothetical protein
LGQVGLLFLTSFRALPFAHLASTRLT